MEYKVFCTTHIETKCMADPLYTLLHTGRDYDGISFANIQGDNTGDNISNRKDVWDGFLTGLYWIWKNTDYEITGQCSYRAYLTYNGKTPISLEETQMLFEDRGVDFIAPRIEYPIYVKEVAKNCSEVIPNYNFLHDPYMYLREAVEEVDLSYSKAFDYVYGGKILNVRHTFITRRNFFAAYCEWLFAVIDRFENICIKRHYEMPKNRFLGHMAEFLERVWLLNNTLNVLELPLIHVAERNVSYK